MKQLRPSIIYIKLVFVFFAGQQFFPDSICLRSFPHLPNWFNFFVPLKSFYKSNKINLHQSDKRVLVPGCAPVMLRMFNDVENWNHLWRRPTLILYISYNPPFQTHSHIYIYRDETTTNMPCGKFTSIHIRTDGKTETSWEKKNQTLRRSVYTRICKSWASATLSEPKLSRTLQLYWHWQDAFFFCVCIYVRVILKCLKCTIYWTGYVNGTNGLCQGGWIWVLSDSEFNAQPIPHRCWAHWRNYFLFH